MIERIVTFCFGDQRHKYVVLLTSMSLATALTIVVGGVRAAPANAFLTALATVILAIPISALLRIVESEAHDLVVSRKLAIRLGRRMAVDEAFAGDLEEYYRDLRERFGVQRANMWYRLQILFVICDIRRLSKALRLWHIFMLLVGIEAYLAITQSTAAGAFAIVSHLYYAILTIIVVLVAVVFSLMKVADHFQDFRSKRSTSERK